MIKLGGLIDLKPLQEEKAFTATSKETGNVSVFKSKAARDAAIKAGTHEKRKTDKDGAVDVPGGDDKPKVNIFNKDKSKPKSEPKKVSPKSLGFNMDKINIFTDLGFYLDKNKSKLSKDQYEKINKLSSDWTDAYNANWRDKMSDDEYERKSKSIKADVEKILSEPQSEPKSDTPNSKTSDFSQEEKKELEALLDTSDDGNPNFSKKTIDDIIETHKDKLSPEQIKDLEQAAEEADENLSRLIGDDWYSFEKYEKIKNDVGNRVKKTLGLDGDKKEQPKSEPQSTNSKTLPFDDDTYDEIEGMSSFDELQDFAQSKEGLSDEQRKQLQDLAYDWEDAEGEMMATGDDDEYEEATSAITAKAMEVVFGPEDSWEEPKSSTPKKSAELSSDEKEDLENRANDIAGHDDIRTIIDDYKDKLSSEQLEVLKQAYDEMEEADHLKYDDESAGNEMFDDAFYKVQDLIQSLDENETTSTRLRDLLPEEETFTAVNKKSGKTSVFKSKASRDAAIKKGTHSKTKEKGDSKKGAKGGVNIFGKDAGTQKSLFPDIKPDSKPTDDSDKIKDPKGMSKVVPKEVGTDVDKMEDWIFQQGGSIGDGQTFGLSDENELKLYDLYKDYKAAKESGDKKEIERTKKDYFEFIYANLEKNQNKPKGPETKDYWNSDNKPAPKVGKFNAKPTKDAVRGLDLLSTTSIGGTPKLTPEDMGDKEYERNMLRMLFNSLEDANFHTHNRFIFADLEGKPEKRNTPDYSNAPPDYSAEKEAEFDKWSEENTIFTKDFNSQFNRENERDDVLRRSSIDISKNSEWGGNEILAAYLQKLRKDGKDDLAARIQKSFEDAEKSMNEGRLTLGKLLPEPIINEGTRSQVGIIDRSGKIASAYVHYDGYPSNMKPGLKKHMKNEKDVLNLIKKGGARGIYNDKDIEYYKSGKPTKGNLKDFEKYVDAADRNGMAEYVYLYNMKDKKWYFADVYGDKKLKKLF